jgi:RNA polymerase sigma-70 factor (ECF subfamily)
MYTVNDESVLVRLAMDGDREAFSDLAALHWRRLVALARSIVADLEAEDMVQDGLMKAWRKIRTLKAPEAFGSWLTRIVANTAIARARRRRFFETLDGVAVAARGDAVDARIDIGRLLTKLAPRQRAVLHLTVVEGLTDSEVAEILGLSSSSVRVHRLRGRRRMAEIVRGERRK